MSEIRQAFFKSQFTTRSEANGINVIEGYFAVFDQETELWSNFFERIDPGAFENSLKKNDIRCLFNHDTSIVLGRNTNGTLVLHTDAHGLWGRVEINPNDTQAMDVYARVSRGDISGCSFGFNPIQENFTDRGDNTLDTLLEIDLCEVSICTFPAYPQTEIQARKRAADSAKREQVASKKAAIMQRIKSMDNEREGK